MARPERQTRRITEEFNRTSRAAAKEWYDKVKKESECLWCGEGHPATLEFHHREPKDKKFTIATMVYKGMPLKEIFEEAAKCDILCSNCHKIHHYEERMEKQNKPKFPER